MANTPPPFWAKGAPYLEERSAHCHYPQEMNIRRSTIICCRTTLVAIYSVVTVRRDHVAVIRQSSIIALHATILSMKGILRARYVVDAFPDVDLAVDTILRLDGVQVPNLVLECDSPSVVRLEDTAQGPDSWPYRTPIRKVHGVDEVECAKPIRGIRDELYAVSSKGWIAGT